MRAAADRALPANLSHLGLRDLGDTAQNVEQIQQFTRIYYYVSFSCVRKFTKTEDGDAEAVLPYVRNVVCERSPRVGELPGFRGKLYPPQAAVLARMFELETKKPRFQTTKFEILISCGILQERCSFGKTYLLAALATRDVPAEADADPDADAEPAEYLAPPRLPVKRIIPILHKNYTPVAGTVVVCSGRVAAEFCESAAKMASIPCVRVHTAASLDALARELLPVGPALFVVKDGETTWGGAKLPTLTQFTRAALEAADGVTPVFARVVFDDYDLLKLAREVEVPYARFYWQTSATKWTKTVPEYNRCRSFFEKLLATQGVSNVFSKVSCSVDYSAVEFNLPRPQFWETTLDPVAAAAALAAGREVPREPADIQFDGKSSASGVAGALFARGDVVPAPAGAKPKILLCEFAGADAAERREVREAAVAELERQGASALALTLANANRFAREDITVGVAALLHGVNMGYLTHVVVNDAEFTEAEVAQIVGRGQRLGRKSSLQVYFARYPWSRNDGDGDGDGDGDKGNDAHDD